MIVLEGPDGAGKTTLANMLSKDLGVDIAPKLVKSDMTAEAYLFDKVHNLVMRAPEPLIYDRFSLISEYIYGPLYNGEVRPGFEDIAITDHLWEYFLEAWDPVMVICLPPEGIVLENVIYDPLNQEAVPHIRSVWWQYYLLLRSNSTWCQWDYTCDHNYGEILNLCKERLNQL